MYTNRCGKQLALEPLALNNIKTHIYPSIFCNVHNILPQIFMNALCFRDFQQRFLSTSEYDQEMPQSQNEDQSKAL